LFVVASLTRSLSKSHTLTPPVIGAQRPTGATELY